MPALVELYVFDFVWRDTGTSAIRTGHLNLLGGAGTVASPTAAPPASAITIANVFGTTIEDCIEVIRVLNDAPGIAIYELNASCPNTSHGGMV